MDSANEHPLGGFVHSYLGYDPLEGDAAIIPIIVGDTAFAIRASERLLDEGVFVTGFGFPVVAVRCRYRSPVRFDDLLTLSTRVSRLEAKGATFSFRLFRYTNGKDILAAEGTVSCRVNVAGGPARAPGASGRSSRRGGRTAVAGR